MRWSLRPWPEKDCCGFGIEANEGEENNKVLNPELSLKLKDGKVTEKQICSYKLL